MNILNEICMYNSTYEFDYKNNPIEKGIWPNT